MPENKIMRLIFHKHFTPMRYRENYEPVPFLPALHGQRQHQLQPFFQESDN